MSGRGGHQQPTAKVAAAASAFGFAGDLVADVRWAGSCCTAAVLVDVEEVARRQTARLGALDPSRHFRLFEVLFELPLGVPVPWADLDPVRATELDAAPPGVVCRTPATVERLWRPAVTVTGVLTIASSTTQGLHRVGILAAHAPRGLATRRRPRAAALERATRLGIGVAVLAGGGEWEVLVAPGRNRLAPSARRWRFLELVYAMWQQRRASQPSLFTPGPGVSP
jgi:hypothetical protein